MTAALSTTDLYALSPLLIVLGTALLILLLESFTVEFAKKYSSTLVMLGLTSAIIANWYAPASTNPLLTPWLKFDHLTQLFTLFFLVIGLATTLLSAAFFQRYEATHGEYYFLLLSALFGLILIGASADFLTLFLGLETLSIALYVLCGYMKAWELSHESSMKYFLMGAIAAACLLYGIALIYGAVGTTRFDALLSGYQSLQTSSAQALFMSGIALVTLGLAFKAAIVPFHVWAPDVYEGAPTPVTAFMAVGTKVGAFAAFIRVFLLALPQFSPVWNEAISFLAYPTLIYANFVALRQVQLRRFFAYSGISHAGFLLIPLAAGTTEALSAMLFYLVVYAIATLGAFSVLAFVDQRKQGAILHDLTGLMHRSPLLAGILALCLLTLAGIPPTAGFFAKFYLFKVAFDAGFYALVIVGLLTTILSAYYYLRIIGVMLANTSEEPAETHRFYPATTLALICFAAILLVSIFPTPLLKWTEFRVG